MDPHRLLAGHSLFAPLSEHDLSALAAMFVRRSFQRGDAVFRQGDTGAHLYVIESGRVKITLGSPDGREALLAILGQGEVFGELSLFDETRRSADARAMEPAAVHMLAHDIFRRYVEAHPAVAWELLRIMARRIRDTDEAMQDVIFFDIPGRVAKRLLDLAAQHGSAAGNGLRIDVPLTQEEIAQMIGASRESVNKALSAFSSRGWIELHDRTYVIANPDALRSRIR